MRKTIVAVGYGNTKVLVSMGDNMKGRAGTPSKNIKLQER